MENTILVVLGTLLSAFLTFIAGMVWKIVTELKLISNSIGSYNIPDTILGKIYHHSDEINRLRDWALTQGYNRRDHEK